MLLFSRQRGRLGRPNTKRQTDEQIRRSKIHVLSLKVSDWIGGQWSLDSRIEIIKPTLLYSKCKDDDDKLHEEQKTRSDFSSVSRHWQQQFVPRFAAPHIISHAKNHIYKSLYSMVLWTCSFFLSFFWVNEVDVNGHLHHHEHVWFTLGGPQRFSLLLL